MSSTSDPSSPKPVSCPICGKPAIEAYRPFCSKRCADIDLGRWFSGGYAIAGRPDDEEADAAVPDETPEDAADDPDKGTRK